MHQALYRRFRPEVFETILGQDHIVKILKNQVRTETTGHAYLFTGTRGTGKTTTARILAKGVNCIADKEERPCGKCENCLAVKDGIFIDVIEIDAASNNGVENIRELRESVKYAPVKGKYKIYIIDEVHMLSKEAFNALLKTLEEPPHYVIFILATTEPSKLPATVLSRCIRLDFRRVSEKIIIENMKTICQELGVKMEESGLRLIGANGDGSVRDSLSLLDKCLATGEKNISREDVLDALGTRGEEEFIELTNMARQGRLSDLLIYINEILSKGIDSRQFIKDWMGHYRNLMLLKYVKDAEEILNLSQENIDRMKDQSADLSMEEINRSIYILANAHSDAKWSSQPRIHLELAGVALMEAETGPPVAQRLESSPIKKTKENKDNKVIGSVRENSEEISKVWAKTLEVAEKEKASLGLLRGNCIPICNEEGCIVLEVGSSTSLRIAEENQDFLQKLISKQAGKSMRLDCRIRENEDEQIMEKTPEEIAAGIGNRLNIDVSIE